MQIASVMALANVNQEFGFRLLPWVWHEIHAALDKTNNLQPFAD
jgi:hypothetical protein